MANHSLTLTNSGAAELMTLANTRGLMTKRVHIRKAAQFCREHLYPVLRDRKDFDLEKALDTFGTFEVTEKTRDALKELVSSAADKGALACTIGTGELLDIFGLAED